MQHNQRVAEYPYLPLTTGLSTDTIVVGCQPKIQGYEGDDSERNTL